MIPPSDAPAGYPFEFERTIALDDGSLARVRPIVPSDASLLGAEIGAADEETLYLRFFTPVVRVDESRLRYLTEIDYDRRFALAAFTLDGEGMAIARYEGTGTADEAEVAVTVKPEFRRKGIATSLFGLLEEAAAYHGVRRLFANYLAANEPAEALMAKCGYHDVEYEGGVATVVKDLSDEPE
jgi:RimJ/RimL family protein N-acetyltransferase